MQNRRRLRATLAATTVLLLGISASAQAQMGGMGQQEGAAQQQGQGSGGGGMQQQGSTMQQRQQEQNPGLAQPEPDRPSFSEDQLESFADAYVDIIDLQESYTEEIQNAEGGEDARELQKKANDEMVTAIEDNELSVPEYSEIANAMDMNPELRDQVASKIQDRR